MSTYTQWLVSVWKDWTDDRLSANQYSAQNNAWWRQMARLFRAGNRFPITSIANWYSTLLVCFLMMVYIHKHTFNLTQTHTQTHWCSHVLRTLFVETHASLVSHNLCTVKLAGGLQTTGIKIVHRHLWFTDIWFTDLCLTDLWFTAKLFTDI